jgi:hypothetical protein
MSVATEHSICPIASASSLLLHLGSEKTWKMEVSLGRSSGVSDMPSDLATRGAMRGGRGWQRGGAIGSRAGLLPPGRPATRLAACWSNISAGVEVGVQAAEARGACD